MKDGIENRLMEAAGSDSGASLVDATKSRLFTRTCIQRLYGAGSEAYCLAQRQLEPELRATRNYTLLMKIRRGNRNRGVFAEGERRRLPVRA